MRGNLKKIMIKVFSFLCISQTICFSLVRAEGTNDSAPVQGNFGISFVYIIMLGAMIASVVLFIIEKIKANKENKNMDVQTK